MTRPLDMTRPLPPLTGATVKVLELGLDGQTDELGEVSFTLPLGQTPRWTVAEGVYTFEVSTPDTPYATTVRHHVSMYESRIGILYSPGANLFLDYSISGAGSGVADMVLGMLQTLTPEQALARRDRWDIRGLALACESAPAARRGEVPVLACQWGRGYNVMTDGRALFWREDGAWKTQPYPAEGVRGVGYFRRQRQQGNDLVVVMNVAGGMTRLAEEVQLLRRTGDRWQIVWLSERRKGYPEILLEAEGIDGFTLLNWPVNRGEPVFRERWQRQGDQYVRRFRNDVPPEEQIVVHFLNALVRGDEAAAANVATGPDLVERAERLGIPRAAAAGYTTARREDGPGYRLVTNNGHQWVILVAQKGDGWVVSTIE